MVSQRSFAAGAGAVAMLAAQAAAQQFVMYTPGGDDTSVQRMDAIISPGVISQHVHQFFGASNISPDMSYQELQSSGCTTVGAANGKMNSQDLSAYWHPALYMQAKDGSGFIRIPTNGHKMYYLDHGSKKDQKRDPFEFPEGFRMVANGPFARAPYSNQQSQNITQWICHTPQGMNQGTAGGFPTNVDDCSAYPGFNGAINFPHCWNGQDYDQHNPGAHMSYPDGDVNFGTCPSSHPIRLPHIFIENQFDLHKMVDKVKPNTFTLAQGDTTGYGWHMDFFNGWTTGALAHLLTNAGCQQGKYGNEDIGGCGGFQPGPVMQKDCKLKTTYVENVDTPGQFLPGCNPISMLNPAPIMATAPLGVSTDQCSPVSGGGDSSSNSSAPAYSAPAYSAPAYSAPAPSATTLATKTKQSSTSVDAAATSSPAAASPPSYGGGSDHGSGFGGSGSGSSSDSSALCPSQNGQTYTDSASGKTFTIECGTDHFGGDLDMQFVSVGASGLADCIAACAANAQCVDVSLSGVACYLKKSLGDAKSNAFVNGAKLVSAGAAAGTATSSPAAAAAAASPAPTTPPSAYGGNNRLAAAGAGDSNNNDSGSDPNVIVITVTDTADPVTVTDWVTVYASEPSGSAGSKRELPAGVEVGAPVLRARHGHAHAHAHLHEAGEA